MSEGEETGTFEALVLENPGPALWSVKRKRGSIIINNGTPDDLE